MKGRRIAKVTDNITIRRAALLKRDSKMASRFRAYFRTFWEEEKWLKEDRLPTGSQFIILIYLNPSHVTSKVPADPDDAAGELCIQPVTCCLSVTKPVKGELIIPAGWFLEAPVAPGPHTAAWLFDGHLNYSGSWLIMGQPVATLPWPASR